MESTDLTPRPPPEDAALEALLREPPPAISDDGFSRRVMMALPEKAVAKRTPWRRVFVAVGTVAGLVITYSKIDSLAELQSDWTAVKVALDQTAAVFAHPNSIIVLSVAGVSALYALVSAAPNRR